MEMIKLFIVAALTILVSTSYGLMLQKKIKFEANGFVTPIGFAVFMMLLQFLYYPAQWFNLSSTYEHAVSLVVYVIGLVFAGINFKEIIKEYLNKKLIWVISAFVVFVYVFSRCHIDITFSDSQMYLNYMSQNINIDHVNLFNLWTGEYGQEWDTIYLFQGYYHFGSFISWLTNINWYLFGTGSFLANITIQTWGLGMIYSIISSMLLVNFGYYFKKDNKWIAYFVIAFGLFYLNFYYWRVVFSYYGNTFRTLYMCALLFYLYRYFKEERKDFKYICIIIGFAGLSFSSSYLFISFSIMYALMVYVFHTKKHGSIREMADFVLPILIYALSTFYKDNQLLFVVGLILASLYFLTRNIPAVIATTNKIEEFLNKYAIQIFVVGVVVLATIAGAIYNFVIDPYYSYDYAHYFQRHSNYDMIKDYLHIYDEPEQNIMNIIRWIGIAIILFKKPKDEGMKFFKYTFIVMLVLFLNPLCTTMIARTIASNVYYRSFDVLINPLTEMLFIMLIADLVSKKYNTILVGLFVAYFVFYCHVGSVGDKQTGEYSYFLDSNILPKYKMSFDNYSVIEELVRDVSINDDDELVVITHADGVRTFLPNAHQLFTARQIYYSWDRVDQEFFQQARNHFSYEEYGDINYDTVGEHLEEFGVDYVIVEWNDNLEFDQEVSKYSDLLYENATYRLYKVCE